MAKSHTDLKVEELKTQALALMDQAGFAITVDVDIVVDPDLTFMGYTTTAETGQPVVVVAEFALKSGMAINLVIHELSHVYRTQTGHPSHNYELLGSIGGWVMQGNVHYEYQQRIIQNIINHIQDVYADDISFTIFAKNMSHKHLNEFFLTWIHEPSEAKDPVQRAWENADNLLSAAFAESNLIRHKVKDEEGTVKKAIKAYLDKMEPHMKERYPFFKEYMVRMPEDVTDKEFESHLIKYLSEFLKLTKNQ